MANKAKRCARTRRAAEDAVDKMGLAEVVTSLTATRDAIESKVNVEKNTELLQRLYARYEAIKVDFYKSVDLL